MNGSRISSFKRSSSPIPKPNLISNFNPKAKSLLLPPNPNPMTELKTIQWCRNRAKLRKRKSIAYMSRPQNIFQPSQKIKTNPKIKSNSKVSIEGTIELKNCSTA